MNERLQSGIQAALTDSEMLRSVATMRRDGCAALAISSATRPLTASEIQELKQLGNWADDWQTIQVCSPFNPRRIRGCTFRGEVTLGRFVGLATIGDGVQLPTGVYASTVVDCAIGDDALVRDVSLLANYVVAERAVVFDCGRVISSPGAKFGNDLVVIVGPQMGGRRVPVYAEIDLNTAAEVARISSDGREWQAYSERAAVYADRAAALKALSVPAATCCTPGALSAHSSEPGAELMVRCESPIAPYSEVPTSKRASMPALAFRIACCSGAVKLARPRLWNARWSWNTPTSGVTAKFPKALSVQTARSRWARSRPA